MRLRLPQRLLPFASSCALAVYCFLRIFTQLPGATFLVFQSRDLARAELVSAGVPILWGPELTGGGVLPGGLYYWLLSVPLHLGLGWKGAWLLLALVWACAWFALARILTRTIGWRSAVLAAAIFVPSTIYLSFNNSSFAPALILAAMASIGIAFSPHSDSARKRALLAGCFLCGLAIQLHYVSFVPLIGVLLLQTLSPKLGTPRFRFSFFSGCLALSLVPLLPYWIFLFLSSFGVTLGLPVPAGSADAQTATEAILELIRNSIHYLDSASIAEKLAQLVPISLVWLLVSLAFFGPSRYERRALRSLRPAWCILFVFGLVALFPGILYFVRPNGARYVAPLSFTLLFATCFLYRVAEINPVRLRWVSMANFISGLASLAFAAHSLPGWPQLHLFLPFVFFLLTLAFLRALNASKMRFLAIGLAGFASLSQSLAASQQWANRQAPLLKLSQLEYISDRVLDLTGWTFPEARKRLFFIGAHLQFSIEKIYEMRASELRELGKSLAGKENWDGILCILGVDNLQTLRFTPTALWLENARVQSDLSRAARSGALQFGKMEFSENVSLVPYRILRKDELPDSFQNIGYPYQDSPFAALLRKDPSRSPDLKKIGPRSWLFRWNECDTSACPTGIFLDVRREPGGLLIDAVIAGAPLEQPSEWTSPNRTQQWEQPFVEVECKEQRQRLTLVDSVGINTKWATNVEGMAQSYQSFLAPLRRHLRFSCSGDPVKIRAGRALTNHFRNGRVLKTQSPDLTLTLNDSDRAAL